MFFLSTINASKYVSRKTPSKFQTLLDKQDFVQLLFEALKPVCHNDNNVSRITAMAAHLHYLIEKEVATKNLAENSQIDPSCCDVANFVASRYKIGLTYLYCGINRFQIRFALCICIVCANVVNKCKFILVIALSAHHRSTCGNCVSARRGCPLIFDAANCVDQLWDEARFINNQMQDCTQLHIQVLVM